MKDRIRTLFLAGSLVLVALPTLHGCSSLAFYGQAISGHLSLMRQREPVSHLLADSNTSPEMVRELHLSQEIIDFAESQLGLDADGSYRQVVISGQPAISWNVVAAPEFAVDPKLWCFPVAGCVPYRGYFKQDKAEEVAAELREEGFDVIVSPAIAYSTLGWFDDPLVDTMFQYSDTQLAGVLFHELAHKKLYLASDTAFSESFAEFVESRGLRLWLEQTHRTAELKDWQARQKAEPDFENLLSRTRTELKNLYTSEASHELMRKGKEEIFASMRRDYAVMVEQRWRGRDYFGGWMKGELNNARLALAESYSGSACAFESLFQDAKQDFAHFYELATEKSKQPRHTREEWLRSPCAPNMAHTSGKKASMAASGPYFKPSFASASEL